MRNNPVAPEFSDYEFILVDEYQDLNKAEQSLIDLLAQNAELLVVGDDDQSIYSFKHAHPAGIIEFPDTHAPLEDVSLQICRRCPKEVVRLANELMGYLLDVDHPKKLREYPENEDGEIYATQWDSVDDEARGIAKLIKKFVSDTSLSIKPEDILVLSPRRKLGYMLKDLLQNDYAISSHTFFQEEALDTQKAQKAYATLNYFVDPDDRVALRVLLGLPTILPASYRKVLEKAQELSFTPKKLLLLIQQGSLTLPRSEDLLHRFQEIETLYQTLKDQPVDVVVSKLCDPSDPEDIEVLLSVMSTISVDEDMDLRAFFLKLQDRIRSPEVTNDAGYLRIMSLHKSKGLTSKVVFVLGCVAGLIPTIKDERQLVARNQTVELTRLRDEAKRLFFVALTRTKKYLFLSSFRNVDFAFAMQQGIRMRATRGRGVANTHTSPFFGEVVKHLPRVIPGTELISIFKANE